MGLKKQSNLGEWLKGLREQAGVTRIQMDAALAKTHKLSSGYTASLENNRIKMPGRSVCDTIADTIGVDRTTVWNTAVWDRLRCFDEELYEWFQQSTAHPDYLPALEENRALRARLAAIRAQTEGL